MRGFRASYSCLKDKMASIIAIACVGSVESQNLRHDYNFIGTYGFQSRKYLLLTLFNNKHVNLPSTTNLPITRKYLLEAIPTIQT